MKIINMTDKGLGDFWLAILMILFSLMVVTMFVDIEVDAYEAPEAPETVEIDNEPQVMIASAREPVRALEYVPDDTLGGIRREYEKWATDELLNNLDWLYAECEARELDPKLVFAVQAWESGWGHSAYCINDSNCFGFGYTDSGKVGNWHGNQYREVTSRILDSYVKQGYGVESASVMSSRGYNFHQSWIDNVNLIISYFE